MMTRLLGCTVLVTAVASCTASGPDANPESAGGDFGATQGGVQDMGLARELIEQGIVPPPEAFVVEGMFSEHDLGLGGAPCATVLCLRTAVGIAPTLDGDTAAWLQVGMSSTIDPGSYQRRSQTLIMTVDVSGSMGWDYSTDEAEYPSPGALARRLLHDVGEQLDGGDRVAIVTYGSSVHVPMPLTSGANQAAYHVAVDELGTAGSTNMEAGLERAYLLAETAVADGDTQDVRVILFTDVRPNVGASTATEFDRIVQRGAESDIGLTVLGLGVGLGQDVLRAIADVRGGNAFSAFDYDDASELIATDWPWMVSAIGYDLSVRLDPGELEIADAYGFPSDDELAIEAATVFLSQRKGALLVRLSGAAGGDDIAPFELTGQLRYQTISGLTDTQPIASGYDGAALDDRGQFAEQPSVAKTTALAVLVDAMARAADRYSSDAAASVMIMTAAHARIAADVEALGDEALAPEVALAADLLGLMQAGAPQQDPYYQ